MTPTPRWPAYRWPYAMLTVLYCAGIFFMSAQPHVPKLASAFPNEDKLLHASVYAGLALLVSYGIRRSNEHPRFAWQFWIPVLFVTVYGITDECHQLFVPNRSFDVIDMLSDTLGGFLVQWLMCFRVWRIAPKHAARLSA